MKIEFKIIANIMLNISLLFIVVILTLFVFEFFIQKKKEMDRENYFNKGRLRSAEKLYEVKDKDYFSLKPHIDKMLLNINGKRIHLKTNSLGLRDDFEPKEIDNDVFRILCLGDSYTIGIDVSAKDAYPKQLEKFLKADYPKLKIEAINAGQESYGTNEELKLLKDIYPQIKPSLIITAICLYNDISDNIENSWSIYMHYTHDTIKLDAKKVFQLYGKKGEGSQTAPKSLNLPFKRIIRKYFFNTYTFLQNLYIKFGLVTEIRAPYFIYTEDTWQVTFEYLDDIYNFSKKNNTPVIFVIIPEKTQLIYDKRSKSYNYNAPIKKENGFIACPPQQILVTHFNKKSYNWLDLTPYLMKHSFRESYASDGHWSEKGHVVVAEIIENYIKQKGFIADKGASR